MHKHNLIKGTGLIAALTSLSRLLGFLRDITVAAVFGAGLLTDAFFVALRIPNLLRSMVAEGALTAAFVPVFSQQLRESQQAAQVLFRNMSGLLLTITILISLLGLLFSPQVVVLFAPGFQSDPLMFDLSISLTRVMFPFIIFISMVAMINGALNSHAVYGAAPIAQIVMNLCMVIAALITIPLPKEDGIYILAWSVVLSGLAQVVVQIPLLNKVHLQLIPQRPFLQVHTRHILKLMVPAILGAAVYQLSILLNTMLASLLDTGSVSWLFYAERLNQLPFGVMVVALGSVLLPALSSAWADKNQAEYQKNLVDSLRFTSFMIIPVATIMFILADPICALLFKRGLFTSWDSHQTARALQAGSVGLWGISLNYLQMRAFMATKDTVTPTLIGLLTLVLTLIISLAFMGPIDDQAVNVLVKLLVSGQALLHLGDFGHAALALSGGLAATLLLPLSFYLLEKRTGAQLALLPLVKSTTILILAALINWLLFSWLQGYFFSDWYHLLWQGPVILIIFLICAKAFRLPELDQVLQVVKARLKKLR